jgi:hypothetical protein
MPQYGSFQNSIAARSTIGAPTPEIGMGATELMWSDRHAYTVVHVSQSGKRIIVQRDRAIRADSNGMSESQSYTFVPQPDAPCITLSLRKNGQWKAVGGGSTFAIGYRSEYHDFSF